MTYLCLMFEFLKAGLFAIGGGMATIPFLYEISDRRGWFSTAQLIDMIAISESTPGPIGVNMATFAGYMTRGVLGALVATFALVLPSYIIILIIARILDKFQKSTIVKRAFDGLRPAVAGLLSAAALGIFKVSLFTGAGNTILSWILAIDIKALILFIAMFLAVVFWKKHPVVYIVAGAVLGIVLNF